MQNLFYKLLNDAMYREIHKFYWTNRAFVYPNAIVMTEDQLYSYYPEIKETDRKYIKLETLCGLKVVLTDYIENPRLLKI